MSTPKNESKNSKIETVVPPIPDEQVEEPPPKFLSDVPIYFWSNIQEKQMPKVPPPTPEHISNVIKAPSRIPTEFPPLTSFKLPYVKEVGIKKCIAILGEFLGCTNYAFDYLQFWFLDMLTDCLWKAQDEYNLREKEQKIVLEWVLYIFQIISDPKLNYSRKTFFTIFKEAMFLAGDVITEGAADVPLPHNLFTLVLEVEKDDEVSTDESSVSTISISTFNSENLVEMQFGDQVKKYAISKGFGDHMSDFPTPSESLDDTTTSTKSNDGYESVPKLDSAIITAESQEEFFECKDYKQFYQADPNIPKRFLPLPEKRETLSEYSTSSISLESNEEEEAEEESSGLEKASYVTDFDYLEKVPPIETCKEKNEESKQSIGKQEIKWNDSTTLRKVSVDQSQRQKSQMRGFIKPNQKNVEDQQFIDVQATGSMKFKKVSMDQNQNPDLSMNLTDSQVLEKLAQYKLWEQRLKDMDDPRKGWVPVEESLEQIKPDKVKDADLCDDEDFDDLISKAENEEFKQDNRKLISMGVLCAIIDLVFEYFYESFHFTLIKLATRATPDIITQALNTEWKVPKANKEELQKPKPVPKAKEKKPKQPKKEKKKKSDKSSKSKGKKGKDKKSKKSSEKKSKKSTGKKSKKAEKPKKLSKEEKAELERQRQLQEEMEEERRRIEENKRFLFPLNDAATDELFTGIFENWVKPVEKGKEGKKEKKGKAKGKKKK